jgi:hypothetical protein
MYIPDRVFVKRLQGYDDKLSVKWMSRRQRWGIYRTVQRGDILVHVVQNEDHSFRPLDERTIRHLKINDMQRMSQLALNKHIHNMEEASIRTQEAKVKAYKDEVTAISEDIAPSVMREAEEGDIGSRNTPQEDGWAALEQQYGEEKADEILS